MYHDLPVTTFDADFKKIAAVSPLRLKLLTRKDVSAPVKIAGNRFENRQVLSHHLIQCSTSRMMDQRGFCSAEFRPRIQYS